MQERLEAAFEYSMDHPEALMLICGTIFGLVSALTGSYDADTTSFLRVMSVGLVAFGILFYVLRLGLRFIKRVFHHLLNM
jgi:hypothetical protein